MNPREGSWRRLPRDLLLEVLKYFERRKQWPLAGVCGPWRAVVLELLGKNVETALELLYMIYPLNTERTVSQSSYWCLMLSNHTDHHLRPLIKTSVQEIGLGLNRSA